MTAEQSHSKSVAANDVTVNKRRSLNLKTLFGQIVAQGIQKAPDGIEKLE